MRQFKSKITGMNFQAVKIGLDQYALWTETSPNPVIYSKVSFIQRLYLEGIEADLVSFDGFFD